MTSKSVYHSMQNLKKHVNFIMAREVFLGIFFKTKIFYFYLVFAGFEEKCEMSETRFRKVGYRSVPDVVYSEVWYSSTVFNGPKVFRGEVKGMHCSEYRRAKGLLKYFATRIGSFLPQNYCLKTSLYSFFCIFI